MDFPSEGLIHLLTYLLPGFITAAILYNLTPSLRPVPFERVVQALIFTILIQALAVMARWLFVWTGIHVGAAGTWSDNVQLVWSVLIAVFLGLVWVKLLNDDKLHAKLRDWRITKQTSYASEWYGVFAQNPRFIVLHLVGERRLYGWPEEWPSSPDKGHFVIVGPQWLTGNKVMDATGVDRILVRAVDVEMVEFMSPPVSERQPDHG